MTQACKMLLKAVRVYMQRAFLELKMILCLKNISNSPNPTHTLNSKKKRYKIGTIYSVKNFYGKLS